MHVLCATAAIMAVSSVVSAQTLTADIPFQFRVGGAVMAPGSYKIEAFQGEKWFGLRNLGADQFVAFMSGASHEAPSAWSEARRPMLSFACGDGGCSLKRNWTAAG